MSDTHCHKCGAPFSLYRSAMTPGYGVSDAGEKFCYPCCGERERESMVKTGRATLYLVNVEGSRGEACDWPGFLRFPCTVRKGRHNIAGVRRDVWFTGPDGRTWHGVNYGKWSDVLHCRATKG